jgi:hypothetical protein
LRRIVTKPLILLSLMKNNPISKGLNFRLLRWLIFLFSFFPACILQRAYSQCTLVCNSNIQISLPESGSVVLPIEALSPTAASLCPGPLTLTIWSGPGQTIPGNSINCAHAGLTLTARVLHTASGNFCTGTIDVVDVLPPKLTCTPKFINCSQESNPASAGFPMISDNCTAYAALEVDHYDITTPLACGTVQNGFKVLERIDRHWQVSDAFGNQSTCTQQIWIKAPELDSVVFPPNRDDITAPALLCGANPYNMELTGQPLLYGNLIDNSGPCSMGITHSDQTISGCSPGSFTVLRTWLVVDYCSGQIRQRIQIIKVSDKTAPVIQAPPYLEFFTSATTCTATVNLPNVPTSDNCSAVSVVPNWAFGSGYGPFHNVAQGSYTLTWVATDACGNTATATSTVQITDNQAPNVACAIGIQASLGTNGQVLVAASSINAGSWDNCGPVFLAASRNDSLYASTVTFTCADENVPVMVRLRVTDSNGLTNFCDVPVTARDFIKPTLTCPANLTLTCLQDPFNLALTGQATATDNCTLQSLTYENTTNLSGCNTGTVVRRWTASDQAGNTRTCSQTITLNTSSNVTVTFPADITLTSCASAANVTPDQTGKPVITGAACFPLNATYTDLVFNISSGGCFSIYRTWKVIDHCIYNPNGGSQGVWEKIQQINVIDQTPPLLEIPEDITVSSSATSCDVYVDLPDAFATDCSNTIFITHNNPTAISPINPSGFYTQGVHTIVFTAQDGCGNSVKKTMTITVEDKVSPTAACINGLSVNIGSGGIVTLSPILLNANSKDNCTPQDSLNFTVTPPFLSCQHIGQQQVALTVFDKAGNTAQCITFVDVQDNQPFCARHTVEGDILTPTGLPIRGVWVYSGQGDSTRTDSLGHYKFDQLLPGKNYTIRPKSSGNWLNGVDAYDLILISRHIINLEPMNTPEKLIAADANISGTVTNFDIVQLRKVLMGSLPGVADGKSWRFIPANQTFISLDNPFTTPFAESIQIIGLDSDRANINFKGIKVGDIDGNVNPQQID